MDAGCGSRARLGRREHGAADPLSSLVPEFPPPLSSPASPPGSAASWQGEDHVWAGPQRARKGCRPEASRRTSRTSTAVTHTGALGGLAPHAGAIGECRHRPGGPDSRLLSLLPAPRSIPQDVFPVHADGKAFICCLHLVFCFKVQDSKLLGHPANILVSSPRKGKATGL